MNYRDFLNTVKLRARLDTDTEAERAIEATLKTLAERLGGGDEADQLAAQLPVGIGSYLREEKLRKSFDLKTFYEKVSERESLGEPLAMRHAQAVMSTIEETVTPGELRDVMAQLPDEYVQLFSFGADGQWRQREGR